MNNTLKIFVEDPEEYQEKFLKKWTEKGGESLERSDSRKILLDTMAYGFSLIGTNFNSRIRQNLVRYAENENLDALGEYKNVERQEVQYAVTTVVIEITEALETDLGIPAQTVTPGSNIYFETEYSTIPAGDTSIELTATCTTAGTAGDGYLPGEINKIVEPFAYFKSVTNTTESQGGSEIEEDDDYREEIIASPEGYSTAGPSDAYKALTKAVNQNIIDVAVYSPEPCYVNIVALMEGGEIPAQTILNEIEERVSDDTKRPIGDLVTAEAPETVSYDLTFTYYISESNLTLADSIISNVNDIVDKYVLWQKSKLGRDINPSELYFKLRESGIKRIEITSPDFKKLTQTQLAILNTKAVTFGGVEDD